MYIFYRVGILRAFFIANVNCNLSHCSEIVQLIKDFLITYFYNCLKNVKEKEREIEREREKRHIF